MFISIFFTQIIKKNSTAFDALTSISRDYFFESLEGDFTYLTQVAYNQTSLIPGRILFRSFAIILLGPKGFQGSGELCSPLP
jgi:hypothetical protein